MPVSDPFIPQPDQNGQTPSCRPCIPIKVYQWDGESDPVEFPNVRCLSIQQTLGPDPGMAVFRYVFDQRPSSPGPYYVEQALSTNYNGPYVITPAMRLLVSATQPDGTLVYIFDGIVLEFDGMIGGETEGVTFEAQGIALHAFDDKVQDVLQRDCDAPTTVSDVKVQKVPQFNPRGKPNRCPDDANSGTPPNDYPVFLDPTLIGQSEDEQDIEDDSPDQSDDADPPDQSETGAPQQLWRLHDAARYLLFRHNAPPDDGSAPYVQNPKGEDLDALLISREPINDDSFDPGDSSTYNAKAIIVPDTPFLGMAWPTLIDKLIEPYGFACWFALSTRNPDQNSESDSGGGSAPTPQTDFKIQLKQLAPTKQLALQQRRTFKQYSPFEASTTNLGEAQLGRDLRPVRNKIIVMGGLKEYECSLVLAPAWQSSADDLDNLSSFLSTDVAFATGETYNAYRTWIFDEAGDGHYPNAVSSDRSNTVPSLDAVFGKGNYVKSHRPPIGQLFQKDIAGKALQYRLSMSDDYPGPYPAVWDGSGTWRHVNGGFRMLRDRIGIRVTINNPNAWSVGTANQGSDFLKSSVVKIIDCFANPSTPGPTAANPNFFLRLTCVIKGDQCIVSMPPRAVSSALNYDVEEIVDARDRFHYQERSANSEFNTTDKAVVIRDDTSKMDAESKARRNDLEAGVFDAEIHIPRFTTYYDLCDRIDQIEGRDLYLRTDNGGPRSAPVYPIVIARRWDFTNGQHTFLTLSDRGMHHGRQSGRAERLKRKANTIKRTAKEAADLVGRHPSERKHVGSTSLKGGLSTTDPDRMRS